ncbi:MAG: hypothetical protein A2X00_10630 [Bacteroidetes bacterium GWE2_32_14]|nr:MAG: hypothetical protein A2X00_10630 [Bacteroidetes bacterium GWE2_32_14]
MIFSFGGFILMFIETIHLFRKKMRLLLEKKYICEIKNVRKQFFLWFSVAELYSLTKYALKYAL